jgi:hypothetical protein
MDRYSDDEDTILLNLEHCVKDYSLSLYKYPLDLSKIIPPLTIKVLPNAD